MMLTEDFGFVIDATQWWIPLGYDYDGASIPRPFWSIIGSPFEPDYWCAVAHDAFYLGHAVSRSVADEVLFQLLRVEGVGLWRARTIWGAVRAGAWMAWNNNACDRAELTRMQTICRSRDSKHWVF
jgi:hypothetical protein